MFLQVFVDGKDTRFFPLEKIRVSFSNGSMEMDNVPEYSIFKVMREMNKPEMKRALGFFVSFMKNMAAETNKK